MQAYSARAHNLMLQDNPLQNSSMLAALLVSHLDMYLATHNDVRFLLLEYPEEHLATVLALQTLIGSDIVKVAGILDGDDPVTVVPSRMSSHRNKTIYCDSFISGSTVPTAHTRQGSRPSMPSSQSSSESLSFAKANFLLTSSATDLEIATFISNIWKILISISEFYIPGHAPRKVSSHSSIRRLASPHVKAASLETTFSFGVHKTSMLSPSHHAWQNSGAAVNNYTYTPGNNTSEPHHNPSPYGSAVPGSTQDLRRPSDLLALPPMPQRPASPAPSVTPSMYSAKSGWSSRSAHGRRSMRRRAATVTIGRAGDIDSLYVYDTEDEEQVDVDERRLMPLFRRRVAGQKANTRKALKWLGLA
jgi:hypothetical protein